MFNKIKSMVRKTPFVSLLITTRAHLSQMLTYPKWRSLGRQERIMLELGAGKKRGKNGWTTVDLSGSDISYNLKNGIPLPPESVDRIYTSHMFEHMPYQELVAFINECFRVLKPDGELSVCVPDASRYIRAYVQGARFRPRGEGFKPAIIDTDSLMDQVNYIAYMNQQHKYMFDRENLINTLKKAPFKKVILREFDEAIDLESRDFESIYASAIK